VANALRPHIGGGQDAFVAKMSSDGASLLYSTYVGGSGGTPGFPEAATGIALDAEHNAYIVGSTSSPDFPTRAALRSSLAGGGLDAFVFKLNAAGNAFLFSTYLGGRGLDYGNAIAVGATGDVCVTGYTSSIDFPQAQATQAANAGLYDAYLAVLTTDGKLKYGTYLGGSGSDSGAAIAVDTYGGVLVAGQTLSGAFPLAASFQSANPGNYGGFLTKVQMSGQPSVVSVSPNTGSSRSQTFSFVISDPDGAADVVWVHAAVNSTLNLSNACYFAYNGGFLYLANDAATETLGVVAIGGSAVTENSQCRLNASASSVSLSGNTLTLNVSVTFKAAFSGTKNIYLTALDKGGLGSGWILGGTWSLSANHPPVIASVTPSGSGSTQTFSFVIADAGGPADVVWAHAVLNSTLNPANACYFAYNGGLLYLANDAATATLGIVPLGGSGTVENSQCRLNASGSSATLSESTLTLKVAITFKAAFFGTKNIYVYAVDNGSMSSGWILGGSWTVEANRAPVVASVTPSTGSGQAQTFSFVISDSDGATDVVWVHAVLNSTLNLSSACYFAYNGGFLYLANDAATATLGIVPLGGSGTVENSQCRLNASGSSATLSGNTLTLKVAITFKTAFSGTKNIYLYAVDKDNLTSNWAYGGSWNTTAAARGTFLDLDESARMLAGGTQPSRAGRAAQRLDQYRSGHIPASAGRSARRPKCGVKVHGVGVADIGDNPAAFKFRRVMQPLHALRFQKTRQARAAPGTVEHQKPTPTSARDFTA
jgi:hypothetical protein